MRSTNFIVATTVVIAATLNFGAQGFPRPQTNIWDGSKLVMQDGFAFDGPASGSKPSTKVPGLPRGTVAPDFPTLSPIVTPNPPTPPPVVDPTLAPIVNPTPPPIVNPTPAPIVNPTPAPIVSPTPAPTTVRPEVAQCAQNCQVTPEYNPVCGSDGVMYNNPNTLVCTRNCGINVTQLHLGRCSSPNIRG